MNEMPRDCWCGRGLYFILLFVTVLNTGYISDWVLQRMCKKVKVSVSINTFIVVCMIHCTCIYIVYYCYYTSRSAVADI